MTEITSQQSATWRDFYEMCKPRVVMLMILTSVVGMLLGIVYGGALIIKETTTGNMDSREVFNSLALMSLSHGLVEDTLVMLALGAKLGGIFWGRLLFSLIVVYLLVKTVDYLLAMGKVKPQ